MLETEIYPYIDGGYWVNFVNYGGSIFGLLALLALIFFYFGTYQGICTNVL